MTATTVCPVCLIEKVTPPREIKVRGMCQTHYTRAKRNGQLEPVYRKRGEGNGGKCEAKCDRDAAVKGLCRGHYARKGRNLPDWDAPLAPDTKGSTCSASWDVDGETVVCGLPNHGGGLCGSHSWQKRNSKPFTPIRSYKSPGGTCEACYEWADARTAQNDGLCGTHYDRRRRGGEDWDRPIRAKAPSGGGYLTSDGYRKITVNGVRVLEHLHVMEVHIGRPLLDTETVHHKKGGFAGRSNNALSNLELWTGRHPKGHRIEDVITYCREMLAVYGDPGERAAYAHLAPAVLEDQGEQEGRVA